VNSGYGYPARIQRTLFCLLLLAQLVATPRAHAQEKADERERPAREARLQWNESRRFLLVSLSFRDVIDPSIDRKLSRGLPTTIVMTATLYRVGSDEPLATTAQTCRVTWHVWEEAYRVELSRPGLQQSRWTTTVAGVLRRCAETHELIAAEGSQVPEGARLMLRVKVQVNPISPELLQKIKRWVSRPSGTGTAAPGDALFSTFTGLFLQRIGDAERQVIFSTKPAVPSPPKEK
jgi:hypothetical protein